MASSVSQHPDEELVGAAPQFDRPTLERSLAEALLDAEPAVDLPTSTVPEPMSEALPPVRRDPFRPMAPPVRPMATPVQPTDTPIPEGTPIPADGTPIHAEGTPIHAEGPPIQPTGPPDRSMSTSVNHVGLRRVGLQPTLETVSEPSGPTTGEAIQSPPPVIPASLRLLATPPQAVPVADDGIGDLPLSDENPNEEPAKPPVVLANLLPWRPENDDILPVRRALRRRRLR